MFKVVVTLPTLLVLLICIAARPVHSRTLLNNYLITSNSLFNTFFFAAKPAVRGPLECNLGSGHIA